MLYFVSTGLSLCYLLFAFLSALGVLQGVAARYHLGGLAFLDYSEHPRRGYALGASLGLAGALIYFVTQWAIILTPGPAGAELTILFGAAALVALLFTLILASPLQAKRCRTREARLPPRGGRVVTVGPARGRLYIPGDATAPMPAVCLLPAYTGGHGAACPNLSALATQLLEQRTVVLLVEPTTEAYSYPEALAIVPAATILLGKLPEVDPQHIVVVGHDLGGDLSIRSAGAPNAGQQVAAVVALAPVLVQAPVGLDLLREMPYCRALRWARNSRRAALRRELTALEYGAKIGPRPLLLVYGSEDRLVGNAAVESWHAQRVTVRGAGHVSLGDHPMALQAVVQWLKEHS